MKFGLRSDWISVYIDEKENFRSTGALGTKMVPSAISWLREARLMQASPSTKPDRLLEMAIQKGCESSILWDLIWFNLANNSPLVKWYVLNTDLNQKETKTTLVDKLTNLLSKSSVAEGSYSSLADLLKNSPLGNSRSPVVKLEMKNRTILSLTRVPRSVDPLVLLYSFYVMAQGAKRGTFTISEMMNGDFEAAFVSPLTAFGMQVEEMKAFCLGLASRYPQFITCKFTLGLDEIQIFPQEKTLDDIIDLILEN